MSFKQSFETGDGMASNDQSWSVQWLTPTAKTQDTHCAGFCHRACLDQLLITIRSSLIVCDQVRSKTSLFLTSRSSITLLGDRGKPYFVDCHGAARLLIPGNIKLYSNVCLPIRHRQRQRFSVTCYTIVYFGCSRRQDSVSYIGLPCLQCLLHQSTVLSAKENDWNIW